MKYVLLSVNDECMSKMNFWRPICRLFTKSMAVGFFIHLFPQQECIHGNYPNAFRSVAAVRTCASWLVRDKETFFRIVFCSCMSGFTRLVASFVLIEILKFVR